MSTLEKLYLKMDPAREASPLPHRQCEPVSAESQRRVGSDVAHELNNILTIIQGYAERLILKHGENPALRPELQVILDNAKRASAVVRRAKPRSPSEPPPMG